MGVGDGLGLGVGAGVGVGVGDAVGVAVGLADGVTLGVGDAFASLCSILQVAGSLDGWYHPVAVSLQFSPASRPDS